MVDFKANLMSKSREIAQIHQKTEIENRTKIKNVISTMDGYLFGLPIIHIPFWLVKGHGPSEPLTECRNSCPFFQVGTGRDRQDGRDARDGTGRDGTGRDGTDGTDGTTIRSAREWVSEAD